MHTKILALLILTILTILTHCWKNCKKMHMGCITDKKNAKKYQNPKNVKPAKSFKKRHGAYFSPPWEHYSPALLPQQKKFPSAHSKGGVRRTRCHSCHLHPGPMPLSSDASCLSHQTPPQNETPKNNTHLKIRPRPGQQESKNKTPEI